MAAKFAGQFPQLKLFTVDDTFGGWTEAQKVHFCYRRRVRRNKQTLMPFERQ